MNDLPHVHGPPPLRAVLRSRPEDFIVRERLGFEPSGAGEHLLLEVRKRETNTDWLAGELARFCGVKRNAVSYAGMKDRHAVTTQTFSIQLPGREAPDFADFPEPGVEFLSLRRHHRKLRRGALTGNGFEITLREVDGDARNAEQRLSAMRTEGVANYFGEQRFGRGGGNIAAAERYFQGGKVSRKQRGLLISAARSHIYNAVLAKRVQAGTWNQCLDGEVCCLAGSHSWFLVTGDEPDLPARLDQGDIHPSGPLWGHGLPPTSGDAGHLEIETAAEFPVLRDGLAGAGLTHDRRPLRLLPADLQWQWPDAATLRVSFELPAGAYATTVLREIASWS